MTNNFDQKNYIYQKNRHKDLSLFTEPDLALFSTKIGGNTLLSDNVKNLNRLQHLLFAHGKYALLVIIQAMDAGGKDGITKHVFAGLNPLCCKVKSFKAPSIEELAHDYLWRCAKELPERGMIGIFNRSYFEEVIIVRVHSGILEKQNIPNFSQALHKGNSLWKRRFEEINNFEKYLFNNGIIPIKIFLNISKEEQKHRFLARINKTSKNWKFNNGDIDERKYWDKYMACYNDLFKNTSTHYAPWHIVPANNKLFARLIVSEIVINKLNELKLHYPKMNSTKLEQLLQAKKTLENE
ncbi:MAG: polyphosphate kinase 2 family protein [Bacteroidales bacterium]|nr:polyphosphate kinase 2 family protein [Bacteroidales bacterium]